MRASLFLAATLLSFALGQAVGVSPLRAADATEVQLVEGEVIQIDLAQGRVTVRSSDGDLHQFEASPETLKELKVGDRIEAKRRPAPSANE
jgi:Cu/Ag efflux protein CusF